MLVLLFDGGLAINSLGEEESEGTLLSLSKILDLASHRAFDTGEWYIPGHKLIGFLIELPASIGGELSNGEFIVGFTGFESLKPESTDFLAKGSDVADANNLLWGNLYDIGSEDMILDVGFDFLDELRKGIQKNSSFRCFLAGILVG